MFLLSDSCCFRITPLDLFEVDSLIKALDSPSCPCHRKVIIKEKKGALISKVELPAWIWGSRGDGGLVCTPSLVFKSHLCHYQLWASQRTSLLLSALFQDYLRCCEVQGELVFDECFLDCKALQVC